MPPNKRKRDILDFDPNKSDPEDESFDPSESRPAPSRKRSRTAKSSKPARKRRNKYGGSDIEDDEVSDSGRDDSFDDPVDDEEDEEEAPINENTGRRVRKAAAKRISYLESEDDDHDDDNGKSGGDSPAKPAPSRLSKIVKIKVPRPAATAASATGPTRRSTRARTAEADGEELVELSASGKHATRARGSKSISPETAAHRRTRTTRGGKAPAKAPIATIEEVMHEDSPHKNDAAMKDADVGDEDAEAELEVVKGEEDENPEPVEHVEHVDEATRDANDVDQPMETVEPDEAEDDEDQGPITRRTRARNKPASPPQASAEPEEAPKRRGLRSRAGRKSKSRGAEDVSDFDPGNDSGDDHETLSGDKSNDDAEDDEYSSPNPRSRKVAKGKSRPAKASRRRNDSADEDDPDPEEIAAEVEELQQASRPRRRRTPTPIQYEIGERRNRKKVDYSIKPLDQLLMEPEDEDPAPTPARRRGRANGAGWDRSLHTIAGPFGGVSGNGAGALFGGPWGAGAAGGVDSDSSDDEAGHRSGMAGNVGMTPTSAGPPGLLGLGQPLAGIDGHAGLGAAAPNVGKVKNQKAYADADPLGVDMNVDFSKVGGLAGHIDQLKEMVQLPLLYPELFTKFHVTPPRGVLFHGPPGTGKTLLARALANSVGIGGKKITFYMRKGADALSKWVGEAEKQLRMLFEEARRTQPSIIFFDEIDGLAPVRSSKQEQIHASIVSTLLALMDGMDGRGQVIVIGATNRPDNIDPALRRPGRFDREFYFPLPDVEARRAIIDINTKDWGLSDEFKMSLARDAKGYGGADLRALCTEAAMNAIQRTYPQIYSSKEKLIVNPDKISITMADFSLSKKKIVPSSERASTSGATPLPKRLEPLLRWQFAKMKEIMDDIFPQKKKVTALEEAMYEPYDDDDGGFAREELGEEFETTKMFRPRLLICGAAGNGHSYLSAAILHYLEGVHVQNFDLPTILGDERSAEQVLVGLFTEVKRHKPSVIFIPNVDTWYKALDGPALTAFLNMLNSIKPTDPVLVLATAEVEPKELSTGLIRNLFGFSSKNCTEITHPSKEIRREYFEMIVTHLCRSSSEFPDPARRKMRVLEELPLAPPPPPPVRSRAEEKAAWLHYRGYLNYMKVNLQPIMDQINRKYKKFRSPVIMPSQYSYLFEEQDPNFVRPDIESAVPRPFELDTDKDGNNGLRDTRTGKFYYNLDIQTIEERLANGYYTQPLAFLRDVETLRSDAKAFGDRERFLKADELMTNVEVDVNDINQKFKAMGVDWDAMYEEEQRRKKAKHERSMKKKALQSVVDTALGTGPESKEGHPTELHTTSAHFEIMMSPSGSDNGEGPDSHQDTNGTSVPSRGAGEGEQTAQVQGPQGQDFATQPASQQPHTAAPGPPDPSTQTSSQEAAAHTCQIPQQRSALQALPPGVSPWALANDTATTRTGPSTNQSTQQTNGVGHGGYPQPGAPPPVPDVQQGSQAQAGAVDDTQKTSSSESWSQAQAHGQGQGQGQQWGPSSQSQANAPQSQANAPPAAPRSSQDSHPNASQTAAAAAAAPRVSQPSNMANLLNEPGPDERAQLQRQTQVQTQGGPGVPGGPGGPPGSQPASQFVPIDSKSAAVFHKLLVDRTSGCTVEQLEQVTRELMVAIWRTRGDNNRMAVLERVTGIFNDVIADVEQMQELLRSSQDMA